MKDFLFISIFILGSLGLSAQNMNPFVTQATVNPNPLFDVAANGTGQVSVLIGNSGDDPMPLVVGDEMVVKIKLSNGIPNNTNALAAMSGTMLNYFNWVYNASLNTFIGTQNQTIPDALSGGVGDIFIQYEVTINSTTANPLNGLDVEITPPVYVLSNTVNDDYVSSYTWTIPACQAGIVAPITH